MGLPITALECARFWRVRCPGCYHVDARQEGILSDAVVVIAAHAFEARAAAGVGRSMVKEPWGQWTLHRGEMWDTQFAVVRCGPGKVASAAAAQAAVQYLDPGLLLSFGTCGCPDTAVEIGTLAVATVVVDVALTVLGELPVQIPDRFDPDARLTEALLGVPGTQASSLLCWEGHVASPLQRPPVEAEESKLTVVDWESAAIAQVAQMWEVPWAALKVVSDHGEPERLRLLALAARRPLQWGAEVFRRGCDVYARDRSSAGGPGTAEEKPT